jgi:hypothetical protein
VPAELLDRLSVVSPGRFLGAGLLELLSEADPAATATDLASDLHELTRRQFGHGFVYSYSDT